MKFLLKVLGGRLGPWIIGAVALVAASGWAYGGFQAVGRLSAEKALEATKAQVAKDANKAQAEAIARLKQAHAEELAALQGELEAHRQAVAAARAENNRLSDRLAKFRKELEGLHDEPDSHAYLSQRAPDAVLERLRAAQRHEQAGDR